LLCKDCCIGVHQHNPFHKIQHWTGKFFNRADLGDLGLSINLGHNGALCPQYRISETWEDMEDVDVQADEDNYVMDEEDTDLFHTKKKSMVFVDSSGIYQRNIRWCQCSTAAPYDIQLLDMRLFPATSSRPSTAFTFTVLDQFYIEAMECKTSAFSFYSKLRRLTDNCFPHLIPVCFTFSS
jgi:CxC2 like cysteine cluster associated with KDZ transposases